jgi:pyridinium-3,5-bisthiocarboxylic acid mononucleotide nickel chelatase
VKLLYLDLAAGVAGDMLLAALIDAGADIDEVRSVLRTMDIDGWELDSEDVQRAGVRATKAVVTTTSTDAHRDLGTIRGLLTPLPDPVRERADRTFTTLAEAEAHVHGTTVDQVHFHEVGALDAIVDIVGTCAAIQQIAPDRVLASPLPLGSGEVRSAHGVLPVPAPATHELMHRHAIPVVDGGEGETVTPTGAALIATLVDGFVEMPAMRIHSVGYGAGDRDTERPNVVRAFVGEAEPIHADATHLVVEANIDDMTPEMFPYVIECLMRAGADDAWVTPIVMKKERPAFLLSALTHRDRRAEVLDALFRETTTFGCRVLAAEKQELDRSWIETQVHGHVVHVKIAHRGGEQVTASPEYAEAVRAARATGRALKDVYAEALRLAAEAQERSR